MMFKFIVLILAFMVSARAELPPTRAAGQGESLKPAFNLYFPPSTVSDMGGINKFIDTGSENLLVNSGFEAQTVSSGWTISNATASAGAAFKGLKSLSLSLTGVLSLSQEITATQYYPNVVSFSLWVKSSITDIQLCSTLATVEQECVSYDGSNQWKKLQVLVTAPSSGAMGLKLKTLSTTSGTILVDAGEFSSDPLKFKNQEIITDWESYTPTFQGFTASNINIRWRRNGENMEVEGRFDASSPVASEIRISFPSGKTSSSNLPAISLAGQAIWDDASNPAQYVHILREPSVTYFTMGGKQTTQSQLFKINGNDYWSVGTRVISFRASVPIQGWTANKSQILTANDVVSSETINWQFKSTTITDCGGADAIGTYNTYSKAGSSNTFSICGTAPTTVPTNSDGMYMWAAGWSNTSNCTSDIVRFDICLGKGLKSSKLSGYELVNKGGNKLSTDVQSYGSAKYGLYDVYNEKTGLLEINSGYVASSSTTGAGFESPSVGNYNKGYFHFTASKNPVISALDAVPRIDYSWENEFSASVNAGASGCPISSKNYEWLDSSTPCTRTGTGAYTLNLKSGMFTQAPSAVCSSLRSSGDPEVCTITSSSTSQILVKTDYTDGTSQDIPFNILVQRQGSDYRSRGDAAAIIAQPTCYVKDVKASGTYGGTFTSGAWQTRTLNTTSGNCSFLSLSSNQITLDAGTYLIDAIAPAYKVNSHKAKLVKDPSGTPSDEIIGSNEQIDNAVNIISHSKIVGQIVLTNSSTFEIQHRCSTTGTTTGFGNASSMGVDEVYTQVKITKVK